MPTKNYKRIVLITGATDGIGKQVALELSSQIEENFVIIHGRCKKKCEATLEYLINENKLRFVKNQLVEKESNSINLFSLNLDYIAADFTQIKEVCRMAEDVKNRFPKLNAFIACASLLVPRKMCSGDGIELTLQINHLSHYILWNKLLPLLENNAPSKILTVGSMLHAFNSLDWNDINCERSIYDKFLQYSRTKLMNHLATFYIHRLLFEHKKQFQVTANVVNADYKVDARSNRFCVDFLNVISKSQNYFDSKIDGVHTIVKLIQNSEFTQVSGKYFDSNGKEIQKNAEVGDVRLQDRLWKFSSKLCPMIDVKFTLLSSPHKSSTVSNALIICGEQNKKKN